MPTVIASAIAGGLFSSGFVYSAIFVANYGAAILTVGALAVQSSMANRAAKSAKRRADAAYRASMQGRTTVIRSSIVPRNIVLGLDRTSGPLVCWFTYGSIGQHHAFAVVLAGHQSAGVKTYFFNEDALTLDADGNVTAPAKYCNAAGDPLFKIKTYLGGPDQQAAQELIGAAAAAGVPTSWDGTRRGVGVTYCTVQMIADYDALGQIGVPNVSAELYGVVAYDPRTGTTAWTDNPAVLARWWLVDSIYSPTTLSAEVNATEYNASANVCDEVIALAAGRNEARYTCNGALSCDDSPLENLNQILEAMDGDAVWVGGAWQLVAGYYRAPGLALDEAALSDAAITIAPYTAKADLFNSVSGTYIGAASGYEPTSYPVVAPPEYQADDGGEQLITAIDFALVNDAARCQMIAWQRLTRARQQLTVSLGTNLRGYDTAPLHNVTLSLAEFGYTSKVFAVRRRQFAGAQLQYVLQETGPAVWAWDYTQAQSAVDIPNTALPNPSQIDAPGAPAVTERLYQTTGSVGVRSAADISCAEVVHQYPISYLFEYRLDGATAWARRPRVVAPADTVSDLVPGLYEFRVRAENAIGVRSGYSPTTTREVFGLTAPPGDVASFTVTKLGGLAYASWALTNDLDVRIGGRVVLRFSPLISGATWQGGYILDEFPGDAVNGPVPLISGTYMAKFADSTGTQSVATASFVVTEGFIGGYAIVATSTQAPAFPGVKTSLAVVGSALQFDSLAQWDSYPGNVDTWPAVDALGQIATSGSYAFDAYIDMTTVGTRRLESDIDMLASDTGDLWDARTELLDSWGDIDGAVINDCDVTLYVSTTDDNPAAAPTWGEWTPLFVADVTCRAMRFRLDFASGNPTHQIAVSTLTVHVKT